MSVWHYHQLADVLLRDEVGLRAVKFTQGIGREQAWLYLPGFDIAH